MGSRDNRNILSDRQSLAAGASDTGYNSTYSFNKGTPLADLGIAGHNYLCVQIMTTLDDTGDNSALNVYFVDDDNEGLTTAASLALIKTFAAVTAAGTEAARFCWPIPPRLSTQKYVGLFYQSTNGALSAGVVSAWFSPTIPNGWMAYPKDHQTFG